MHIDSRLIAMYIAKECNPEEKKLIEDRIKSDPDFAKAIRKLKISTNLQENPSRFIDTNEMWKQLEKRIVLENAKSFYKKQDKNKYFHVHNHKPRRSLQFLRYAAIFIFAISLPYFFSNGFSKLPWQQQTNAIVKEFQTVKVKNGERQNITLPDGSLVTVDAGSEIKYFTKYEDERHVYLKGEACFNVAHDENKPFYVHAEHAVVRVVGTRFNVRSWETNPDVVITVAEGKVLVSRTDSTRDENTVILTKNEQSTVPLTGPLTHLYNIDAERYFRWMQNEVHFVNSKVSEVVTQLERWYDYQFSFRDPKALDQIISVHIRGANVEEVIRVISVVTSTNVNRNGRLIEFF